MLSVLVTTHMHTFSASQTALLRSQLCPSDRSEPASAETITSTIWSLAHDQKAHLSSRTRTLPRDDPAALLKYVPDWCAYFRGKNGHPRRESWELSNVGLLQHSPAPTPHPHAAAAPTTPTPDPLSITRVCFTNGAMPVGPPFGLGLATAPDGPLTIALSWQEGAVSPALMAGLLHDLDAYIRCFDETGLFCR
ncbi:hypothetical protein E4U21_005678 [Claviceps maximensis]|nr:hypothetical protein E4U21_005678 [Claviceps maximensis]